MSHYRTQLHPWCIIRLLPNAQRITVARFRKRNDAEAHARTLKRLIPEALFVVIFEPPKISVSEPLEEADSSGKPFRSSKKAPQPPNLGERDLKSDFLEANGSKEFRLSPVPPELGVRGPLRAGKYWRHCKL